MGDRQGRDGRDGCGAPSGGGSGRCGGPVEAAAGVGLCREHLVAAYEWMVGEVGVTDVLPSPCPACGSRLGVSYPSGWLCAVCEWRHGEHPDPGDSVWDVPGERGRNRASARDVTVNSSTPGLGRVDVVYYLRWRDRIKIGTSSNPRSRLAQLRHEELLAFERGGRTLDQARHAEFAALRLGGEWFSAEGELLEHVARLQESGDDPWLLHARWRSAAAALARSADEFR